MTPLSGGNRGAALIHGMKVLALAVAAGHLTPRSDGRFDVSDTTSADGLYGCQSDDWCILHRGHPGECCEDRETWVTDGSDPYADLRAAGVVRPWWSVVSIGSKGRVILSPHATQADAAAASAALVGRLGPGALVGSAEPVLTTTRWRNDA